MHELTFCIFNATYSSRERRRELHEVPNELLAISTATARSALGKLWATQSFYGSTYLSKSSFCVLELTTAHIAMERLVELPNSPFTSL